MVAESRGRSARGSSKPRSRSPAAAKQKSGRSKSPAPTGGAKRASSGKSKAETPTQSTASSGSLVGLVPLLAVALAMGAFVAHRNATSNSTGGTASVDFMGFSGKEVDAFITSLTMILISELGDKTFFIAAVLAMKNSRAVVLCGALGALALMTVLSAAVGGVLTQVLPHRVTHCMAVVLFLVFGVKLLLSAQGMDAEAPSEELEEVEAELSKSDKKKDRDMETGVARKQQEVSLVNAVLWQAFTLTFVAEWGDRSQVSTIALAAQKDGLAVTAGGVLGHAFCTSLAVIGGRMLASRISERTVTLCGGCCFLLFAVHGMLQDPSSSHND